VNARSLLIGGIGNVFLGDDGFGVEVAQRLAREHLPEGVRVVDFGIRGYDLAIALMEHDEAILVDAMRRGGSPGTLYVLEPALVEDAPGAIEPHDLTPEHVLALVRTLGGRPPRLRILGCEPETCGSEEEPVMGLSPVVTAAVDEAVALVRYLVSGNARRA
jgi:hydrogenase maturation protease